MSGPDLATRLARLAEFFDLDALAEAGAAPTDVQRYYRASRIAYSRYHDKQNTLHVGLSRDGTFRLEDVFAQLEIIAGHLPKGADTVLELATGRGANAAWLAARFPTLDVHGIDLSPVQLRYARRAACRQPNYRPQQGNFHDLSAFEANSIDLAFVLDALCYSTEKSRVLAEIARVLKPGGVFVVFDGYGERADLTPGEARAARLLARGMAVPEFEPYRSFRATVAESPLTLAEERNYSAETLPTVRRFEGLAERFFRLGWRARMLNLILPRQLTANAVSGYLFPILLETGVVSYWLTVMRKPAP